MYRLRLPSFYALILLLDWTATFVWATTCTLKSEPQNRICGRKAVLTYDGKTDWPIYFAQIVDSSAECAALCFRRNNCVSFSFESPNNLCQLGRRSVDEATIHKPQGNRSFYDIGCWECGAKCDEPYGTQLLDNGDFQGDLLGPWDGFGAKLSRGENGKRFYSCANFTRGSDPDCELYQTVPRCTNNTLYVLEFDYRALVSDPKIRISMRVGSEPFLSINPIMDPEATTWNTGRLFIPTAQKDINAALRDFFVFYNSRTTRPYPDLSLDNIKLYAAPPDPQLVQPEKNLFTNGDFETGSIEPWNTKSVPNKYITENFTLVSPGIESDYAVAFNHSGAFGSPFLKQSVTTTPGSTYLFSFQVNELNRYDTLVVSVGDSNYSTNFEYFIVQGRQRRSALVTVQSSNTVFSLYVASAGYNTVLIDNIKLVEVAKSKFFP